MLGTEAFCRELYINGLGGTVQSSLAQAGLGDQNDTEFYNCDDVTIPRVQDPSSLAHCSMQHCMTAA